MHRRSFENLQSRRVVPSVTLATVVPLKVLREEVKRKMDETGYLGMSCVYPRDIRAALHTRKPANIISLKNRGGVIRATPPSISL